MHDAWVFGRVRVRNALVSHHGLRLDSCRVVACQKLRLRRIRRACYLIYRNHFLFLLWDQGVHLGRLSRDWNRHRWAVHLWLAFWRHLVMVPFIESEGSLICRACHHHVKASRWSHHHILALHIYLHGLVGHLKWHLRPGLQMIASHCPWSSLIGCSLQVLKLWLVHIVLGHLWPRFSRHH